MDDDYTWDALSAEHQLTVTTRLATVWPGQDPAGYWDAMAVKDRRELIWGFDHPTPSLGAWMAEQKRLNEQADASTRAAFERLYGAAMQNGSSAEPPDDDEDMVRLIDWSVPQHDPDDLVDGVVISGRWSQFIAGPKVGKSSLALWIALELSEGRDPFDSAPVAPVTVLYCDGEMGQPDLEELVRACGRNPVRLGQWFATADQVRLDNEFGAGRLLRRVDQLDARLVVLDGLNGFVDPAASENDDKTWRPFDSHIIQPLKRRGVAIVSGDNMGKDPTRGSRGSSVKSDKADAVIQLQRTDNGIRLHPTHGRGGAFITTDLNLNAEGFDRARPIRYWRGLGGFPAGTDEAIKLLNALGIPLDDGRPKVRARLREEIAKAEATGVSADPFRLRNDVLQAALRQRRLPVIGTP